MDKWPLPTRVPRLTRSRSRNIGRTMNRVLIPVGSTEDEKPSKPAATSSQPKKLKNDNLASNAKDTQIVKKNTLAQKMVKKAKSMPRKVTIPSGKMVQTRKTRSMNEKLEVKRVVKASEHDNVKVSHHSREREKHSPLHSTSRRADRTDLSSKKIPLVKGIEGTDKNAAIKITKPSERIPIIKGIEGTVDSKRIPLKDQKKLENKKVPLVKGIEGTVKDEAIKITKPSERIPIVKGIEGTVDSKRIPLKDLKKLENKKISLAKYIEGTGKDSTKKITKPSEKNPIVKGIKGTVDSKRIPLKDLKKLENKKTSLVKGAEDSRKQHSGDYRNSSRRDRSRDQRSPYSSRRHSREYYRYSRRRSRSPNKRPSPRREDRYHRSRSFQDRRRDTYDYYKRDLERFSQFHWYKTDYVVNEMRRKQAKKSSKEDYTRVKFRVGVRMYRKTYLKYHTFFYRPKLFSIRKRIVVRLFSFHKKEKPAVELDTVSDGEFEVAESKEKSVKDKVRNSNSRRKSENLEVISDGEFEVAELKEKSDDNNAKTSESKSANLEVVSDGEFEYVEDVKTAEINVEVQESHDHIELQTVDDHAKLVEVKLEKEDFQLDDITDDEFVEKTEDTDIESASAKENLSEVDTELQVQELESDLELQLIKNDPEKVEDIIGCHDPTSCGHEENCERIPGSFECFCPAGFDGDPFKECYEIFQGRALVQGYLDGSVSHLIGLEYVLEIRVSRQMRAIVRYRCCLCSEDIIAQSKTGSDVIDHVTSYSHMLAYLEKHFSSCGYKFCDSVENYCSETVLRKCCEEIRKELGNPSISITSIDYFENSKEDIKHFVENLTHWNESNIKIDVTAHVKDLEKIIEKDTSGLLEDLISKSVSIADGTVCEDENAEEKADNAVEKESVEKAGENQSKVQFKKSKTAKSFRKYVVQIDSESKQKPLAKVGGTKAATKESKKSEDLAIYLRSKYSKSKSARSNFPNIPADIAEVEANDVFVPNFSGGNKEPIHVVSGTKYETASEVKKTGDSAAKAKSSEEKFSPIKVIKSSRVPQKPAYHSKHCIKKIISKFAANSKYEESYRRPKEPYRPYGGYTPFYKVELPSSNYIASAKYRKPSPPRYPESPVSESHSRSSFGSKYKPYRKKSRSPSWRRSRSPFRQRSRSPNRRYSRSPDRRRSRSHERRYRRKDSRSPQRYVRNSPRKYSRSPVRRRSRTPTKRYSKSPNRRYSKSPNRRYSKSPNRRFSRSPPRKYSRSPSRRRSKSPSKRYSRSPQNRSKSPQWNNSRPNRERSRSQSPHQRYVSEASSNVHVRRVNPVRSPDRKISISADLQSLYDKSRSSSKSLVSKDPVPSAVKYPPRTDLGVVSEEESAYLKAVKKVHQSKVPVTVMDEIVKLPEPARTSILEMLKKISSANSPTDPQMRKILQLVSAEVKDPMTAIKQKKLAMAMQQSLSFMSRPPPMQPTHSSMQYAPPQTSIPGLGSVSYPQMVYQQPIPRTQFQNLNVGVSQQGVMPPSQSLLASTQSLLAQQQQSMLRNLPDMRKPPPSMVPAPMLHQYQLQSHPSPQPSPDLMFKDLKATVSKLFGAESQRKAAATREEVERLIATVPQMPASSQARADAGRYFSLPSSADHKPAPLAVPPPDAKVAFCEATQAPSASAGNAGRNLFPVLCPESQQMSREVKVTLAQRLAAVLVQVGMVDVPAPLLQEMLMKIGAFSSCPPQDIKEQEIIDILRRLGYI